MNAPRYKYPRTPHLPWSPGASVDDIRLRTCPWFENHEVVVTEKMDGENTTLYRNAMHARSLDSRHHPSRDWVKAWHGSIAHDIPEAWRLCGENLFARHSIEYDALKSYFYLFSIWDSTNRCLAWDDTLEWASLLGCPTPRELYRGPWNAELISAINIDQTLCEGYVVRRCAGFSYEDFPQCLAKWVRPAHVTTDEHWMYALITPNRLGAACHG
jgi:RNA ligase